MRTSYVCNFAIGRFLLLLLQVDATQEADLGQKYGVNGYPTIKWFVDGEVAMDYSGSRDA